MARYAINFAITVWVDDPDIEVEKYGDDIRHLLTDKEYNELVSAAVDAVDIKDLSGNVGSIERIQ